MSLSSVSPWVDLQDTPGELFLVTNKNHSKRLGKGHKINDKKKITYLFPVVKNNKTKCLQLPLKYLDELNTDSLIKLISLGISLSY